MRNTILFLTFLISLNAFALRPNKPKYITSFGTESPYEVEHFKVLDKYECQILSENTKEARIVEGLPCQGADTWTYTGDCNIPEKFEIDGVEYTITTLGYDSFGAGVTSIILPNSIKYIEDGCLDGTSCIEIELPESLQSIGSSFSRNNKVVSLTLPSSLQYIGANAFQDNESLETLTFNAGLLSIGEKAFSHNPSLKEALLPHSVRFIKDGAFENCQRLERVRIPRFLHYEYRGSTIGGIFNNCPNISLIEQDAISPGIWANAFDKINKKECTVIVPDGCKENYINDDFWKDFIIVERSEYSTRVEEVLSNISSDTNNLTMFTIGGLKINNPELLTSGEIYFEIENGKVTKKIK